MVLSLRLSSHMMTGVSYSFLFREIPLRYTLCCLSQGSPQPYRRLEKFISSIGSCLCTYILDTRYWSSIAIRRGLRCGWHFRGLCSTKENKVTYDISVSPWHRNPLTCPSPALEGNLFPVSYYITSTVPITLDRMRRKYALAAAFHSADLEQRPSSVTRVPFVEQAM
ncbi:hypothetical protein M404DRAFT_388052 [Pisolithus tinctorius Marx 270]|uniref:Uncharacterized protein n=1 Tax=Pisolithus tinctorius Marx 270 TaxID=870435 RepID=A0A0C3KD42_PISTI|nr:hypothetical protein M404DRAFT_388052 [Pisolithus tinctorius Marx 270]